MRIYVLLALVACLSGCALLPHHSSQGSAAQEDPECDQLRGQISRYEAQRHSAPPSSNSPVIEQAAQAKADDDIEPVKQRYAELGCGAPAKPAAPTNPAAASLP